MRVVKRVRISLEPTLWAVLEAVADDASISLSELVSSFLAYDADECWNSRSDLRARSLFPPFLGGDTE